MDHRRVIIGVFDIDGEGDGPSVWGFAMVSCCDGEGVVGLRGGGGGGALSVHLG